MRPLFWLRQVVLRFVQLLLIAWAALAIYYSNLPWPWARFALALIFAGFGVWALWVRRSRVSWGFFACAFFVVAVWWFCIPPSNTRDWRPEVAILPRAVISGDHVQLSGVRNFNYRSESDFDLRYEQRKLSLARLVSVDLLSPIGRSDRSRTLSLALTSTTVHCRSAFPSRFGRKSARRLIHWPPCSSSTR